MATMAELYQQLSSSPAFARLMMQRDQQGGGLNDPQSWGNARLRTQGLPIPPMMPQQAMAPQQMPSQAFSALGAPQGAAPMPMPNVPPPMPPQTPNRGGGGGLMGGLLPEGGELRERLGDALLGMVGGATINDSLAGAGRSMLAGRQARRGEKQATAQENRTRQYAIQLGMDPNMAMGLDGPSIMRWIVERGKPADPMDALRQKKLELEIGDMENPKPGQDEYGLQPIITQEPPGPDGKPGKYHLFQASKAGGPPKEIPLPYGWTPHQQYLDTGTGYQAVPRQGVGSGAAIHKDIAGEAAAKAAGTAQGVAGAEMPAAIVDAKRTVQKIDELLADPNLSGATGWQGYLPDSALPLVPGAGSGAFASRTKINQLHGRAFMDAYATLKGGGQITEIEGQKATEALARITQPGIGDEDYKVALRDFRDAVQTGLEKIAARAGQTAPDITGEGGEGTKPSDWTDAEWGALTPEEKADYHTR